MGWIVLFAIGVVGSVIWALMRGGWRASSNGNQTRIYKGSRITIFESDGGWKYCIADPSDQTPPYFSDPYPSQTETTASCLALIDGYGDPNKTKRELRYEAEDARNARWAEDAAAIYDKCKSQIDAMISSGDYKLTGLRSIQKNASRQVDRTRYAYQHLYSQGEAEKAQQIWDLRDRYKKMDEAASSLIRWMESGTENERSNPPSIHL